MPILKRTYKLDKTTNFKFRNICLIKTLTIKKNKDIKDIYMVVNGVTIKPSKTSSNSVFFDFKKIREYMRDLLGLDEDEVLLSRLENTFVYNDLKAMSFYKSVDHTLLKNYLFSNDELNIVFNVIAAKLPNYLDVEEEYIVSDLNNN